MSCLSFPCLNLHDVGPSSYDQGVGNRVDLLGAHGFLGLSLRGTLVVPALETSLHAVLKQKPVSSKRKHLNPKPSTLTPKT